MGQGNRIRRYGRLVVGGRKGRRGEGEKGRMGRTKIPFLLPPFPPFLLNSSNVSRPFELLGVARGFQAGIASQLPVDEVKEVAGDAGWGNAFQVLALAVEIDDQRGDGRIGAFEITEPECPELGVPELVNELVVGIVVEHSRIGAFSHRFVAIFISKMHVKVPCTIDLQRYMRGASSKE